MKFARMGVVLGLAIWGRRELCICNIHTFRAERPPPALRSETQTPLNEMSKRVSLQAESSRSLLFLTSHFRPSRTLSFPRLRVRHQTVLLLSLLVPVPASTARLLLRHLPLVPPRLKIIAEYKHL